MLTYPNYARTRCTFLATFFIRKLFKIKYLFCFRCVSSSYQLIKNLFITQAKIFYVLTLILLGMKKMETFCCYRKAVLGQAVQQDFVQRLRLFFFFALSIFVFLWQFYWQEKVHSKLLLFKTLRIDQYRFLKRDLQPAKQIEFPIKVFFLDEKNISLFSFDPIV